MGYNWLRNAYAVPLLKFSLSGGKKKKGRQKIGLTKLPHKTFKILLHHKLKTTSRILCDINMRSCWLQGKFTNLLAGESLLAYPASPPDLHPQHRGLWGCLPCLSVCLGALWPFMISKQKRNANPAFRHRAWTIWLVNGRLLWLFLAASIMEVLPFLTRPSRQVFCKPVISTTEELIRQKSNLARKKEKLNLISN